MICLVVDICVMFTAYKVAEFNLLFTYADFAFVADWLWLDADCNGLRQS